MVTACLIALSGVAAACDVCVDKECKSPGYWKNHPDAWPLKSCEELKIGCESYTVSEAIYIMQEPVKGDKTYTMFDAVVAAKLNVKCGCCQSEEIKYIIEGANRWMMRHKPGSEVEASSSYWQDEFVYNCDSKYPSAEVMYQKLDAFNNGYYC